MSRPNSGRPHILQIVDATNANSYWWAIRDGRWPDALRLARDLAERLGPEWRERIEWTRPCP